MARYTDREQALSHPFANGKYDKENANEDFIRGFESYKEWLEHIPIADVRENVHGKWDRPREWTRKSYRRLCTNCQNVAYYCGIGNYNFCPNCGADMRERREDEQTH